MAKRRSSDREQAALALRRPRGRPSGALVSSGRRPVVFLWWKNDKSCRERGSEEQMDGKTLTQSDNLPTCLLSTFLAHIHQQQKANASGFLKETSAKLVELHFNPQQMNSWFKKRNESLHLILGDRSRKEKTWSFESAPTKDADLNGVKRPTHVRQRWPSQCLHLAARPDPLLRP